MSQPQSSSSSEVSMAPPTLAATQAVVKRWRSDTLATIDASVHTATPIDMEWLNGRMSTLQDVLDLLSGVEPERPRLIRDALS